MKFIRWALVGIVFFSFHAYSTSDSSLESNLIDALAARNIKEFSTILKTDVNISKPTTTEYFSSGSLCQSTRLGNEKYFDAILESGKQLNHISPNGGFRGSAIACAIFYDNFYAYERLVESGIDLHAIQNPDALRPEFHNTVFEHAVSSFRYRMVWDMIQRIKLTKKQLSRLIFAINTEGGVQGRPVQVYRSKVIDWLRNEGHSINPKPAGPIPE